MGMGGIREPDMPKRRKDRRVPCLGGCGRRVTMKPPPVVMVPICSQCRAVKSVYNKAMFKWRAKKAMEKVNAEAAEATASLPQKPAFTPLQGEAMVLKMLRGEW